MAGSTHRLVLELYRRALHIREQRLGPNSPTVAATLSNLSVQLSIPSEDQSVDEAESLLRRGLQIRRDTYGDDHPEVAHSLNLLANLMFYQRRKLDDAERLYTRSLEIRERYYMRHSDRVAQTLHNLAALARAQGMDERAEALYKECLEIRRDLAGGLHPETQRTASQLLVLYKAQGRKEEAARIQKSISAWRRQSNSDAAAQWLRDTLPFEPPGGCARVPAEFKLNSRLIGAKGVHLKHIQRESGASHVFLGPANASDAADAVDAAGPSSALPAILIEASSEEALRKAKELCAAHLANVRTDLARWLQRAHTTERGAAASTARPARAASHDAGGGASSRPTATLGDFLVVKGKGRTRTR